MYHGKTDAEPTCERGLEVHAEQALVTQKNLPTSLACGKGEDKPESLVLLCYK